MMALARKLVSGESDSGPVEDILRQARQVAAEAEQLLVDADWQRPAPEPGPVDSALPLGDAEPVVELVSCGGHHGRDDQQSLFS